MLATNLGAQTLRTSCGVFQNLIDENGHCYISPEVRDSLGQLPLLIKIPTGEQFDHAFAIGKYEVSQRDFNVFCKTSNQCKAVLGSKSRLPVTNVAIDLVEQYLAWLSEEVSRHSLRPMVFRLPTEQEWEHAASAGGVQPKKKFNCRVTSGGRIIAGYGLINAHSGKEDGWGLSNFVGNVRELARTKNGLVARGGSYELPLTKCDIAVREPHSGAPDATTGFRILFELPPLSRQVTDPNSPGHFRARSCSTFKSNDGGGLVVNFGGNTSPSRSILVLKRGGTIQYRTNISNGTHSGTINAKTGRVIVEKYDAWRWTSPYNMLISITDDLKGKFFQLGVARDRCAGRILNFTVRLPKDDTEITDDPLTRAYVSTPTGAEERESTVIRRLSCGDYWVYEGEVRPGHGTARCHTIDPPYCIAGYCAHGQGELATDGSWSYKGAFADGYFHGYGRLVTDFHDYIGSFNRGKPSAKNRDF